MWIWRKERRKSGRVCKADTAFVASHFKSKVQYLFSRNEGLLMEKNNTSVSWFTVQMPVIHFMSSL